MADSEVVKKNKYRRKKAMLKRIHKKTGVIFGVVIILLMLLGIKVFAINYTHGEEYSKAVLNHQSYTSTTLPYKRGQIVTGDGTVLAYSEKVYNLILDVKLMTSDEKYIEPTLSALVQYFDLKRNDLNEIVNKYPNSQYQKLIKELKAEDIEDFKNLMADSTNGANIKGVWFEDSYIRKYPFSTLACDVVGFASAANGGELGIESQYDEELTGTNGTTYSYVDEGLDVSETQKAAVDGNNVVLTIDYNVQSIIEKCIKEYNAEKPSKNTAVVVMDPNNGEILGMASYPVFDLNNPRDLTGIYSQEDLQKMSDEEYTTALYALWKNYCVSESYEPGSTFKPVTVASALESGVAKDGDNFECTGSVTIGPDTLRCHVSTTRGSHGVLTIEEALMQSCNPYMINLAVKMGTSQFLQYQSLFGYGRLTGIDLPGETTGITYKESNYQVIDAACNSFGQNINVNMIQMISAYCSIINDGKYYQPHVVKRIESANGEVIKEYGATLVRQTITTSTSKYLRRYLKSTVDSGLAKRAGVTGYSIAGKTGTAQKQPRADKRWIISFIGHAPADNPKFAIYVLIDEPDGTNGVEAGSNDVLDLSHNILEKLLPYMNVFKDVNDEPQDTSDSPVESTVDGIPSGSLTGGDNNTNSNN